VDTVPTETPPLELAWDRAPGSERCIDGRRLASEVEATLGRRVVLSRDGADRPDAAHGRIAPAPAGRGWIAVVEVGRAGTEPLHRELALNAADCRALDETLVLVVALLLDATAPPREARPLTIAPAAEAATVSATVGPDFAVTSGMLPGVAFGVGLASTLRIDPLWPATIAVHAWPVSEAVEGGSGGRLAAWTFGAGVCPLTLAGSPFELFACAGGSGGAVTSTGVGLDVSHDNLRPYVQVEARAGVRVRIATSFAVRLELGAAVPIARDSYDFTAADGTRHEVFRTAAAMPLARAGFDVGGR